MLDHTPAPLPPGMPPPDPVLVAYLRLLASWQGHSGLPAASILRDRTTVRLSVAAGHDGEAAFGQLLVVFGDTEMAVHEWIMPIAAATAEQDFLRITMPMQRLAEFFNAVAESFANTSPVDVIHAALASLDAVARAIALEKLQKQHAVVADSEPTETSPASEPHAQETPPAP